MISDDLLEILRCPLDKTRLSAAEPELVAKVNRAVQAGTLVNMAGEKVEKHVDDGLIRAGGDLLYPVIDQIPVMLPDEAIPLKQLEPGDD